jgi:hypothetical protein
VISWPEFALGCRWNRFWALFCCAVSVEHNSTGEERRVFPEEQFECFYRVLEVITKRLDRAGRIASFDQIENAFVLLPGTCRSDAGGALAAIPLGVIPDDADQPHQPFRSGWLIEREVERAVILVFGVSLLLELADDLVNQLAGFGEHRGSDIGDRLA